MTALVPSAPERHRRWSVALATSILVVLLGAFGSLVLASELSARRALASRFETRAVLSGSFARSFIDDFAAREVAQAERLLAGADVTQSEFESVVESFDLSAAVLLDGEGAVLQVWPAKPALIGQNLTTDYPHLRAAVAGRVGVSDVVRSAAKGLPIVAVAVPFETATGRRVFSGGFRPTATPLGAYLDAVVPVAGGAAFVIDASGAVLATGRKTGPPGVDVAGLGEGVTEVDLGSERLVVAAVDVPSSTWRVVLTAPQEGLYAPASSRHWASWLLWLAFALTGSVAAGLLLRLQRARAVAAAAARTDPLTGLPNRRSMQEALDHTAALSLRHGTAVAALMIDLDRFKAVNDTFGHDAGDAVICATARALEAATRDTDQVARWGGEEFLVLLHQTDATGAAAVAERVRIAIASAELPRPAEGLEFSASIGVAVLQGSDIDELLREADCALYAAKAKGRNRVEVFETGPAEALNRPRSAVAGAPLLAASRGA